LKINKSGAGIIAAGLNAEDDSSPATALLEPPVQKACSAPPQRMVHVFLKNHQIFEFQKSSRELLMYYVGIKQYKSD
jgi:hypothetical protein